MLTHAPATETLSMDDQLTLLAAAQSAPCTVYTDPATGEDHVTYGATAASEAALEALTLAFLPAIRKAAGRARPARVSYDEAFSAATEAFVLAVREHDPASSLPFVASIATILDRAVGMEERASDVVRVRDTVSKVYDRIMREHENDVLASYVACQKGETGLAPATFLAVREVLRGIVSLSLGAAASDDDNSVSAEDLAALDGPEAEIVDAALMEYLMGLVTEEQERILRLAYGFQDTASDDLRVLHGYRLGEILSDAQLSPVVGLSRPTAQRRRVAALDVMREALTEEVSA